MPTPHPPQPAARAPSSRPAEQVMVGDRMYPADAPVLRADDRGFLYGDGIFETIRVVDGRPRHLDRHVERLTRALETLRIAPLAGSILAGRIDALLTANGRVSGTCAVRVTVSRGAGAGPRPGPFAPTVVITARPLGAAFEARRQGAHLRTLVGPPRLLAGLKSLCYLPSVLALQQVGPEEEPLFVSPDGVVREGATCNVFARFGDRLHTPPDDGDLLPGIARDVVLERAHMIGLSAEPRRLTLADLRRADAVWITNALLPVAPVVALDGQALGPPDALDELRRVFDDPVPTGATPEAERVDR